MLRVGLTGGLGSGKSTVARMFSALGVHVIEADAVGRELMQPGQAVFQQIAEHFGPAVVREDGALDRRALAALAFDRGRLEELNRIVHPPVIAAQEEWMRSLFAADPNAVAMIESALIFEAERSGPVAGWRQRFDRLILVTVPDALKVERFIARAMPPDGDPGLRQALEADAWRRLAAQIPDAEKIPSCDYVIENAGPLEKTRDHVQAIYHELATAAASS